MISGFNGVFYSIIYLVILLGTAYYTFSTLFQTKKFLAKYRIEESGAFMVRFAGTFLMPIVILMLYMFVGGIEGNWIFFVFGFLQALTAAIVGYITVEKSGYKNLDGEKFSSEGYLAPIIFCVAWALVIYGGSSAIYE